MNRPQPTRRARASTIGCASALLALALGCSGGSSPPPDPGDPSWHLQDSGTTHALHAVAVVDAETAWVVGAQDTMLRTTDGGQTWSPLSSPLSGYDLAGVAAVDARTAWVVGTRWSSQEASILKTTDGGATWAVQLAARPSTTLAAVTAVDAATAWAVGASTDRGGLILKTVDGGVTWQVQPSGILPPAILGPIGFSAVASRDGVVAWVGGGYGCGPGARCAALARTSDGGATWTSVSSQLAAYGGVSSIAMIDANTIWIVSEADMVSPSAIQRNVGSGWAKVAEGPPSFRAIAATDASTAWTATTSAADSVLRTLDGGATWIASPSEPTFGLEAMAIGGSPPSVGWAVGQGGTILRTGSPLR